MGKLMSMTGNMELAVNNPFRYRGYYYDEESGLYYLNSRYYDPQTGRFINADSQTDNNAGLVGFTCTLIVLTIRYVVMMYMANQYRRLQV